MSEPVTPQIAARIAGLSPEKRALLAERLKNQPAAGVEPIAVIGVGCRFPGADGKDAFWDLLRDGVDAVGEVPPDRWNVDALYSADPLAPGTVTTRWGGFLRDIDRFDAGFFGIAPREAMRMDPQQRLLLEVAWHAFEDAGQTKDMLSGSRTGVFVGIHSHSSDYASMQFADPEGMDAFTATGTAHNFMSGRLSYWLNLQGPSLVVDTACSSSLVAVHLACQSLRAGECVTAVAAGVNLMAAPQFTIAASRMHMLSPDGRCMAFDSRANGFVRSEGCGVVVLKRLSDARSAGDRVLAVIRGTAVNQDGRTNGITAPNGVAQQGVIRDALRQSGLEPAQVTYVEAHGTGTALGDPIEVESLSAVLGAPTPAGDRCVLGSAKTNLGHLEGAAGIAGLIKVVLCLQHRQIPPVVHFRQLNPHIAIDGTRLEIATSLREWQVSTGPRIAGVSSFGWSGTNAHAIVEEAPARREAADVAPGRRRLLPISARTPEALDTLARTWQRWCDADGARASVQDACETAARRREHHEHRAAFIGSSMSEIGDRFSTMLEGAAHPDVVIGRTRERSGVVFVFPGQGSQWVGMGRDLYANEPAFRDALDTVALALSRHVEWSLVERLHAEAPLDRIDEVQPILFAIEVALAALWRARGVHPDAVVGHSMGEVAAAHVAGALCLEDAAAIICLRSRLLRRVSGRGAMAAIELSMDETAALIAPYARRLSVAVSNSPTSTVVAGDTDAIDELLARLDERDVFCRRIKVDVASHSAHMDPLRADLLKAIEAILPRQAAVPIYSTVTSLPIVGTDLDAGYWARNLREPVLMSKTVEMLARDGHSTFIEMSPHPILLQAIETTMRALDLEAVSVPSVRRGESELGVMLASAARLYVAGHAIEWTAVNGPGQSVDVPQYPFQRERYWLPPSSAAGASTFTTGRGVHPIVGAGLNVADRPGARVWQFPLETNRLRYLLEHRLDGVAVLPASVSIEIVLACCADLFGDVPISIRRFELVRPLVLAEGTAPLLQVSAAPGDDGRIELKIFSMDSGDATLLVSAQAGPLRSDSTCVVEASQPATGVEAVGDAFYCRLEQRGISIGDALRTVLTVTPAPRGVTGELALPGGHNRDLEAYRCAPALTDGLLQLTGIATGDDSGLYLPALCGEVRWHRRPTARLSASVTRIETSAGDRGDAIQQDLRLVDDSGALVLEMLGLQLRRFGSRSDRRAPRRLEDSFYEVQWRVAERDSHSTVKHPSRQERWVIVADRGGIGDGIAAWLSSKGQLTTVIGPDDDRGWESALDAALGRGPCACRGVVFARGLDAAAEPVDAAALQQSFANGTVAALQLTQALLRREWVQAPRVWLVTRGAQPVGDGAMAPWQAPLLGFGRAMAEEHHELFGALVDLDPAASQEDALADLGAAIWDGDAEPEVAYRGRRRYVARLARRSAAAAPLAIHRDGSYVVTGGFGAVGAVAARWLVAQGARRLVLIGRTELPPRAEWTALDPASGPGRRIELVRELESAGASIHIASLSIDDEIAVSSWFDAFEREGWPRVRGVLHCATVIDPALIVRAEPVAFAAAMRAKATGAFVLERRLSGGALDFFVHFSSIAAWLPQPGQASYAAGNAFLDALAVARRRQGRPAVSVNWGVWRGGASAAADGIRLGVNQYEDSGIEAFDAADGFDAMRRLIGDGTANALVMPVDWARYRAARGPAATLLVADLVAEPSDDSGIARAASFRDVLQGAPASDRRGLLETHLQEHLARVLRLPITRIEPLTPLGSLGLESLMTLEFRNRLEASLGVKLSATLVWNHPTVRALASHLAARLDVALDAQETPVLDSPPPPAFDFVGDIADLSEDDALRALMGGA